MPVFGMSFLHGWSGCNVSAASPPLAVAFSAARTTSSSSPATWTFPPPASRFTLLTHCEGRCNGFIPRLAPAARAQPLCPVADSIKYNIVWQKLLNYTAPFPWKEVVAETEVPYYISHANAYGPPMDSRHTCQDLFAR